MKYIFDACLPLCSRAQPNAIQFVYFDKYRNVSVNKITIEKTEVGI